MADESLVGIEVAYATPEKQCVLSLEVPEGTDLLSAAKASRIDQQFPEIDWRRVKLGVFGKLSRRPEQEFVNAGDRIEIYRPLIIDPKQARRNRAEQS